MNQGTIPHPLYRKTRKYLRTYGIRDKQIKTITLLKYAPKELPKSVTCILIYTHFGLVLVSTLSGKSLQGRFNVLGDPDIVEDIWENNGEFIRTYNHVNPNTEKKMKKYVDKYAHLVYK